MSASNSKLTLADSSTTIEQLQSAFNEWNTSEPRIGQTFRCDVTDAAAMQPGARVALVRALHRSGFAVFSKFEESGACAMMRVERVGVSRSASSRLSAGAHATLDRMVIAFDEWRISEKNADRLFIREISVDDLEHGDRVVLLAALAAAGFSAREIEYSSRLPRVAIFVERAPVDSAAVAEQASHQPADDQACAAAVVDETNRQFNRWLASSNFHAAAANFWAPVHVKGLSDACRGLVRRLLRGNGFEVNYYNFTPHPSPDVFHVRRAMAASRGEEEEEEAK